MDSSNLYSNQSNDNFFQTNPNQNERQFRDYIRTFLLPKISENFDLHSKAVNFVQKLDKRRQKTAIRIILDSVFSIQNHPEYLRLFIRQIYFILELHNAGLKILQIKLRDIHQIIFINTTPFSLFFIKSLSNSIPTKISGKNITWTESDQKQPNR